MNDNGVAIVARVNRAFLAAVALAVLPPLIGALLARRGDLALLLALAGAGWVGVRAWRPAWPVGAGALWLIAALLVFAGSGGVAGGWLLIGMTATLCAWDLDALHAQMRGAHVANGALLWRLHWQRLALVATVALLLGGLALAVTLRLNFATMFVLALIALAVAGAIVRRLLDDLPPD